MLTKDVKQYYSFNCEVSRDLTRVDEGQTVLEYSTVEKDIGFDVMMEV